jgi:DNA polymerase III delta subunit
MTLIELKKYITNKTVPAEFMIFVAKDCPFLAAQYVQTIGGLAAGGLTKIASIYEPSQSSIALLTSNEEAVHVLYVDTFDERAEDYEQFERTIVVCDQIDKSISKAVEQYVIKFPKLEEWQILDYAKTICKHVDESDLLWLVQATGSNIERVTNELEKVALFPSDEQKAVFAAIRFDPQSDLYKNDLFTVVNALVEGDTTVLYEFIRHNGYEELEPVVLANRAFSSLKNIILVSQNPGLTAEDCGMSAGQFRFLKYKYHSLNINAIKQKLKFLSNFDLDLKTSRLEMSKRDMANYLVSHLCYKITA